MRNSRFGTALLSVGLALTVLGAAGTSPVGATGGPQTFSGNVTICAGAGLSGTQYDGNLASGTVDMGPFTVTVVDGTYVTISDVSPGVVFSGVVLKGGDSYHVYSAPVAHMQSPLSNGDTVPALSHWFVCFTYPVTTTTMTPTTELATTTTTETILGEGPTTTEVGSEGPSTTEVGSEGPATAEVASEGPTKTLGGDAEGGFEDLPRTGRTSNELVALGALLVVLGGAIMWSTRRPLS